MSESSSRSVELHPGGSFLAIARFAAVLASPPSRAHLAEQLLLRLGAAGRDAAEETARLANPLLRRAGNAAPAQTAGATGAAQKHWTPERPACARQSGSVVVVVAAPVPAIVVVVGSGIVVVVVAVIAATSPLTITRSWSTGVVSNHVSSSLPSPVTSPTAGGGNERPCQPRPERSCIADGVKPPDPSEKRT